jgi:hypothetical protein
MEVFLHPEALNEARAAFLWYSTRRFLFRRFPFSLIYFIQETSILVVAVAHGRRKPGYWNNRK